MHLLSFTLAGQRFAIPLEYVERVLRSALVTLIPDVPILIYGLLDYSGEVILTINLRNHLKLKEKEITENDRFIITHFRDKKFVLVVDEVETVVKDKGFNNNGNNGTEKTPVVMRDSHGILMILDLEKLNSDMEKTCPAEILSYQPADR